MVSHSLPLGYRIRKAKFTDLPQLVLQIFASNGLRDYIDLKNHLIFIFFIIALNCYIAGFNLARDTLFFIVITAIVFVIYFLCIISSCETWVIQSNNEIIASVGFSPDISKLEKIYVKPKFRHRGFASYLIKYLQKHFKQPIFVTCHPELFAFFDNLGFIKDLENKRQFAWGKAHNLIPMYHPNNEIELTETETQVSLQKVIDKFEIIQGDSNNIDEINRINIFNQTMDFFLPFGVNCIWIDTFIQWLFRSILWNFLVRYKPINSSDLNQSITIFVLFIMSFSLIVSPSRIFGSSQYFWLQKNSQLILIKYENKIIGYARILKKPKYSILNHVYIPTSVELEIIHHLIQTIVDKIAQPVIIACTKQELETYRTIGFKQIDIEKLPKKLRFGGWLNEVFGGHNLAYIPKK